MIRSFVRLGLLLPLFLAPGVAAHGGEMSAAPLMALDERVFDFKEVKEGPIVQHTFRVLNRGNQILEIKQVKTS